MTYETYELSKKLKEAGFPQPNTSENYRGLWIREGNTWHRDPKDRNEYAYAPTLEELMEACGEGLKVLCRTDINPYWEGKWLASNEMVEWNKEDRVFTMPGSVCLYPTPSEAVANLWLQLNKK